MSDQDKTTSEGQPESTGSPGDYSRHPGALSQWDREMFLKAGLTPREDLEKRFLHDRKGLLEDIAAWRGKADERQWQGILAKAELGGRFRIALMLTPHGEKADLSDEYGMHRDTGRKYIRLYDTLPWAAAEIRSKAQAALLRDGRDYTYSIDEIIEVGNRTAKAAGAIRTKPRYTGEGKVMLIDPTAKTVDMADLPAGFPGTKSINPHWEQVTGYDLQTDAQLWKEVGGKPAYFTFDLPVKDTSKSVTMPFQGRVLLVRMAKRKLLGIATTSDSLLSRIDFEAREPKRQTVFVIDPMAGTVIRRDDVMDDEIIESYKDTKSQLLTTTPFTGLSIVSFEPDSVLAFAFSIGEQRFKGKSYLLRLEPDSQWIAQLGLSLSIGDVKQHITFNTLDAAMMEAGEGLPEDDGYEEMTDAKYKDYFGVERATITHTDPPSTQWVWPYNALEQLIGSDNLKAHIRRIDGKDWLHVAKVRELVEKARADIVAAEAEGFSRLEREAHGVLHGVTGDQWQAVLGMPTFTRELFTAKLDALGCHRKIGDTHFYRVDKMMELATGAKIPQPRDITTTEDVGEPLVPDGFLPEAQVLNALGLANQNALLDLLKVKFGEDYGDQPIHYGYAWGSDEGGWNWHLDKLRALINKQRTEPAQEPVTETDQPKKPVADVEPAQPVVAEPVAQPVQAKPEPEFVEAEIINPDYSKMGYADRALADRKLINSINGRTDQIERLALSCVTRFKAIGQHDGQTMRGFLQEALDTVDKMLSVARHVKPDVATLAEHLDIIKAEARPDDPLEAIKRDIIRLAPHLDLKVVDILACYVRTPDRGMVPVFEPADQSAV